MSKTGVLWAERWAPIVYWLIPIVVLGSVWVPVITHYHVRSAPLSAETIEELRTSPSDRLLVELGTAKHALIPPIGRLLRDPVSEANAMLEQFIDSSSEEGRNPDFPVDPSLLGSLDYAMLVVPRTLLKAYETTRDKVYFDAARSFVLNWADFESGRWIPTGLLWNDHAIAARAITYSEFWRLYRRHPDFDPDKAKVFLDLVVASAMRLADPKHYTHSSNHGTMQNVALMHLSLAFPELDGFESLAELAMRRQLEQIGYMVSPEGLVLEHSAGYHRLGMELMGVALRYQVLLGKALPAELIDKYGRARDIYGRLVGPNGSLPPIGDTSASLTAQVPLMTEITKSGLATPLRRGQDPWRASGPAIYPDAGYAIWWSTSGPEDLATQSTVSWSWFPRHGHKHADELSLNTRTGDVRWWTSVGYWPLDHSLRQAAVSWGGSNAPHLADEPLDSTRVSELLGSAAANGINAVDLQRSGPDSFSVRRQIVFVEPAVWITVDTITDRPGRTARVVWGTDVQNRIRQGPVPGSYHVVPAGEDRLMQTHILSSAPLKTAILRASEEPFAGWVENEYRPTPADALVTELSSENSWLANVSFLDASRENAERTGRVLPEWEDADHWQFRIGDERQFVIVRREGEEIIVTGTTLPSPARARLQQPLVNENWHRQSQALYQAAETRYNSGFTDLWRYRLQVTTAILALLLLQVLAVAIARRSIPARLAAVRAVGTLFWLVALSWIHLVYLVV